MKLSRVLSLTSALALLVAGPVALAPAAGASPIYVDTGKPCNYHTYKSHYTVAVSAKNPVLTHIRTFSMPPSASHRVTKTVTHATTLRAAASYKSNLSLSASGAARIFASASVSTHISLAGRGSHTRTTSVRVTDMIRNPTRHNATFVFYAGDTRAAGSYRYYLCEQKHAYSAWHVMYAPGRWRSYGVHGDGAVRCGAGTRGVNSLGRLALRIGCR
jgi:hypothetical protein